MVTIVKHEHHQVDSQFAYELTKDTLEEIYPDMDEAELDELWEQVEAGEADIEQIISDAYDNDVEIEWNRQYDDWWTDRKGGYDVSYEYGDDDSWHEPDTPPEPTHKCTKCRWQGQSYESSTQYLREDGSVIDDYFNSDEEHHSTKDVCPMCDNDLELTPEGVVKEQERKEREARWAEENEEKVPCFSCGLLHNESDLPELNGQLYCPDCNEGWVMMEDRDTEDNSTDEPELSCHECSWEGARADAVVEDELLLCPECNKIVGHVDDSPQEEASLDDLRNELYNMMKKKDD